MADWSTTTKHEPSSINNGRKYEKKDRLIIEQLNNMTENAFYAMKQSDDAKAESANAKKIAEDALSQTQSVGTKVFENNKFVSDFNADTKANVTYVDEQLEAKFNVSDLLNLFPVGTIITKNVDVSPAGYIGGKWTKIADNINLPLGDKAKLIYGTGNRDDFSGTEVYAKTYGYGGEQFSVGEWGNTTGDILYANQSMTLEVDLTKSTNAIPGIYVWKRVG